MQFLLCERFVLLFLPSLLLILLFRLCFLEKDAVDDFFFELSCKSLQPFIGIAVTFTDKVVLEVAVLFQKIVEVLFVKFYRQNVRELYESVTFEEGVGLNSK